MNLGLTAGGYVAAVVLFWLWLGAREDLASEREQCNTDKVAAVAEASEAARVAEREAADAEIARLSRIAKAHAKGREIVAEALREAEAREPVIRTIIQEVERGTSAEQCLDLPVPQSVADSL